MATKAKAKKSARSGAKTRESPRARHEFMRNYSTDSAGNTVLTGLTLKETVEYEEYRDLPVAERKAGNTEDRFQALHHKHEAARKKLVSAGLASAGATRAKR
jgi:hypothetical protein